MMVRDASLEARCRESGLARVERAVADIAAILHTVEVYATHRGVRGALRLSQGLAQRGDAENASTRSDDALAVPRGRGVENLAVVASDLESRNRGALAWRIRIPRRRQHYAQCGAAIPVGVDSIEGAFDRVFQEVDQIGLEPHHNRLRLGVSQPAVELERAWIAFVVDHHPGVEKSTVWNPVRGHAVDGGYDNLAHDARVNRGRHHRRGRVGTHAAGVGPRIAVEEPLMILRRGERENVGAIGHDDEARFLAGQECLDDYPRRRS